LTKKQKKLWIFKNREYLCTLKKKQATRQKIIELRLKTDLVAQLVEHIPFKDGVLGSSPSQVTFFYTLKIVDLVAQLVEHIPFKDGVLGSSPSQVT
jgi:hypothetical protein